jgi:hypothetical protein
VNVSQALDDIKSFLESDPLVQAAVGAGLPASTRQVLADAVRALEADQVMVTAAAAEQARAEAAATVVYPPEQPQ